MSGFGGPAFVTIRAKSLKIRKGGFRPTTGAPGRDEAMEIAVTAFAHIAEDPARVERFAALSGLDPGRMRDATRLPGFLPAVLDYLAGHEPDLMAFAAASGIDPARIAAARQALEDA